MKRLVTGLVMCLALAGSAWADDEPPAPVGTQVAELDGVRVMERVIEGRLLAAAVLPESIGHGLAVLILPADAPIDEDSADGRLDEPEENTETPRQLWALFADPLQPPRLLAGDLPSSLVDLELHRGDGDAANGRPGELWLGGDGVIYRFDVAAGQATAILAAPGLDLDVLELTGVLNLGGGGVAIPELGRLRVLDSDLRESAVYPLPVAAQRRTSGLILSSPHVVRPRADGMPFFIGPEPQGSTRLLVRIIDPLSEACLGGQCEPVDAWIRLPSPEDVERAKYVVLDGIPRLAVTTTNAEKLGIFEEMGFCLYALRPDRTRGGVGPLLAVQTKTKHWYAVGIEVADLDGDGKDDLALIQPEGMGAGDLILEVYRGLGDGRVSISVPRRSKFDAPDGRWHWGDDFTGDGVPDLFLASRKEVELLAGEKDHRSRVVEKRATWGWEPDELAAAMKRVDGEDGPVPPGHYSRLGRIRAHDLDGDGDLDLSLATGRDGRIVVRFVIPN